MKTFHITYSHSGRRLFLFIIFATCLIVSFAAFRVARNWEQKRFEFEFERLAKNQANQVVQSFHSYQTAVQFVGNFLENTVGASRKEFRGFARNVLETYPGMQAISWNPRIRINQRRVYEKAGRDEGIYGFKFKERDADGKMVRAKDRPEYVIVYYIEPLKGNSSALGFDIASNSKRLRTINKARKTGEIVITEKINLVQGDKKNSGALIMFPIYKHGVSLDSPKARGKYLEGFSVGVIRIGLVLERTMTKESFGFMDVYLYDESAEKGSQLLYQASNEKIPEGENKELVEAGFHWATGFEMGKRKWKIILKPSSAFENSQRSMQSWVILSAMVFFTVFLVFYINKSFNYTKNLEQEIYERKQIESDLQSYREKLEELVRERTQNLRKVNAKLENEINERKQTSILLQKSEALIRAVVDNLVDGIITINDKGIIETFNPAAESIFMYKAKEVCGKNIKMLMPQPYYDEHDSYLENYKRTGNAKIIGIGREVSGQRKDGSVFPLELSVNAMQVGSDMKFTGIIRDITERKIAENSLQKAKEDAESANRAKSEFLANMSHEIRTPMNAVLGFTDLLSNMIVERKQKDYLESISIAGRGLLTLINDILDLSKIEAGKLELEYEFISIKTIINEIKQVFALKVAEKELEFIVEIDKEIPPSIFLDDIRLRQILFNLLGNAVKFTHEGHIRLSTHFLVDKNTGRGDLHISIEDTGVGIAEDQHSVIFEAFRQQDGQSNRKYGGTGLGLRITKRLVEIMNGSIYLQSSIGKGSIFSITFIDLKFSYDEVTTSNVNEESDNSDIFFNHAKIMVVDDIGFNRQLVKESLVSSGLEVIEAEDGETALILAEKEKPELIFMDIRMPGMDGYETTRLLKNKDATSKIPVIALTANTSIDDNYRIEYSGFDGFLLKPVARDELIHQLMRFLSYTKGSEETIPVKDLYKSDQETSIVTNLPELISWLKEEIFLVWKDLEGTMEMDEIEDFAHRLRAKAKDHNAEKLKGYAENLLESVSSFDIGKIKELLKKFEKLIDELQKEQNIDDKSE